MRLKADTIHKEDLQSTRAWGALGFKIMDEIDRAMCAAEGIAALSRAADLVTLADYGGYVRMWMDIDGQCVAVDDGNRWYGPDAIAEAAAWVRQRGGA
jgi:hypothetical protein